MGFPDVEDAWQMTQLHLLIRMAMVSLMIGTLTQRLKVSLRHC